MSEIYHQTDIQPTRYEIDNLLHEDFSYQALQCAAEHIKLYHNKYSNRKHCPCEYGFCELVLHYDKLVPESCYVPEAENARKRCYELLEKDYTDSYYATFDQKFYHELYNGCCSTGSRDDVVEALEKDLPDEDIISLFVIPYSHNGELLEVMGFDYSDRSTPIHVAAVKGRSDLVVFFSQYNYDLFLSTEDNFCTRNGRYAVIPDLIYNGDIWTVIKLVGQDIEQWDLDELDEWDLNEEDDEDDYGCNFVFEFRKQIQEIKKYVSNIVLKYTYIGLDDIVNSYLFMQ